MLCFGVEVECFGMLQNGLYL